MVARAVQTCSGGAGSSPPSPSTWCRPASRRSPPRGPGCSAPGLPQGVYAARTVPEGGPGPPHRRPLRRQHPRQPVLAGGAVPLAGPQLPRAAGPPSAAGHPVQPQPAAAAVRPRAAHPALPLRQQRPGHPARLRHAAGGRGPARPRARRGRRVRRGTADGGRRAAPQDRPPDGNGGGRVAREPHRRTQVTGSASPEPPAWACGCTATARRRRARPAGSGRTVCGSKPC